jgi:hypothetical protein
MAYAYICIGPHGVWTKDGTRYLVKGDRIDTLEDVASGMHRRFAVIEVSEPEFQSKTKTEKPEDASASED